MMDSQADDLKLRFEMREGRGQLTVVKIDCVPTVNDDWLENEVCKQILDNMRGMYKESPYSEAKGFMEITRDYPRKIEELIDVLGRSLKNTSNLSEDEIKRLLLDSQKKIDRDGKWT